MHLVSENGAEDRLLLQQLQQGDTAAFDTLYDKYWAKIYAAAFKRLEDPDQAKDVTQDVFLQLWLKRAGLQIDNLPAYLFTSVKNKVFNLMEKERRYIPVPDIILELKVAPNRADAELLEKELVRTYEALIDSLPHSQQAIYRMRYQQDMSTSEIAVELNISRKTVQNQLGKAVAQLRASLALLQLLLLIKYK